MPSQQNINKSHVFKGDESAIDNDVVLPEGTGALIDSAGRGNDAKTIKDTAKTDPWWYNPENISTVRWNKSYPYQLLIVKKDGNGSYTIVPDAKFTLPLPPTSISYTMPFAVNGHVTQGGYVEEHNGAPIRQIVFRGSTGFLPSRGVGAESPANFDITTAIAGGTINAVQQAQQAFQSALSTINGNRLQSSNIHREDEFSDAVGGTTERGNTTTSLLAKTTGYYQFRLLKKYLEGYAYLKKDKEGNKYRLALAMWKDEAVYLVTPVSFNVNKDAGSPMEYQYSLAFKAFRRIAPGKNNFVQKPESPIRRDPNKLARALNVLTDARRVFQAGAALPAAVIGDFNKTVMEPLREATLLLKDALGATAAIADLPDTVIAASEKSLTEWYHRDGGGLIKSAENVKDRATSQWQSIRGLANETRDVTSSSQALTKERQLATSPLNKTLQVPKRNFEFLNQISLDEVRFPVATSRLIQKEQDRVRNLRRKDFEIKRDGIANAAAKLAIALGAGDPTFEATYNISAETRKDAPTESDWEALSALEKSVTVFDALAATGDNEPSSTIDGIEVMAQLHRRNGAAFNVPTSKFAVPMPYDSTLEDLAKQYLGDPNRWIEIAALNGLREPYIDEEGYETLLVTNGFENTVAIPKTTQLFLGQTIYIGSTSIRRTRRRIIELTDVGDHTYITVDGDADLDVYKTVDEAKISAFLPDTINSQQLIYIPSNQVPSENNFITKAIPGVDEFDPMVAVGGVDWLLDSNNDLIITPDGDSRLAVGLTNIIQNVRVALSITTGSLLGHPDFGLPFKVGQSTAEMSARDAVDAIRRMLANDPSFVRIDAIQVNKDGPLASINISVVVNGTEQPIPISFENPR